jgi:hypothetical protein
VWTPEGFRANDRDLLVVMDKWLTGQIAHQRQRLVAKEAEYKAKDWVFGDADKAPGLRSIERLGALQKQLRNGARALARHGSDGFLLANIVRHEAGACGALARLAVACAYLNRTAGTVRPPAGAEISAYRPAGLAWVALDDAAGKMTFIEALAGCMQVAAARLGGLSTDVTSGATHWVSPRSLPRHSAGRYQRSYAGVDGPRAFPDWARASDDPKVKAMQASRKLAPNYREIEVPGVPGAEFLFYVGVRGGTVTANAPQGGGKKG